MNYNFELFERATCSDEEKRSLFDLIRVMGGFSVLSIKEGLLSLEDFIEDIPDPFFRRMVQLVLDGTEPEVIREIGEKYIYAKLYKGKELLASLMIYTGVTGMQNGYNPRVIEDKLLCMIPELEDEYRRCTDRKDEVVTIQQEMMPEKSYLNIISKLDMTKKLSTEEPEQL